MANVKISDLTEASSVTSNDYTIIDDGTSTKKYKADNINKVNDVQVNGTSVLSNKVANITGLASQTQLDRTDRSLDYLWKKSKGVIYDTEVINGTTYDVDIPSGAMEYASCEMLGGQSIKFNQVFDSSALDNSSMARTKVDDEWQLLASAQNGFVSKNIANYNTSHKYLLSITAKGTSSSSEVRVGQIYTNGSPSWQFASESITTSWATYGIIYTPNSNTSVTYLRPIQDGRTSGWDTIYIKNLMLFDLTAMGLDSITNVSQFKALFPLDYYAYDTGSIKDAKVDKQISNGVNLLNITGTSGTTGGIAYIFNQNGSISVSGSRTDSSLKTIGYFNCVTNATYTISAIGKYTNMAFSLIGATSGIAYVNTLSTDEPRTFTTTRSEQILVYLKGATNGYVNGISFIKINDDSKTHEYPINSNIQALDSYGLGINNTCYNYVSFTPTTYHNMKSVDLGTLTWGGTSGAYTTTLSGYVGNPLHSSIPSTSFSYSGTTLTVNSSTTPSGILHYEATSGGTDYNAYLYHKKVIGVTFDGSNDEGWSLCDNVSAKCANILPRLALVTSPYTTLKNYISSRNPSNANYATTYSPSIPTQIELRNIVQNWGVPEYTLESLISYLQANPITFVIEIETEQIIDITQYCEQDFNIREIEANGTLQNHYPLLDNGYGINMNSTLECMVEVSEVQ